MTIENEFHLEIARLSVENGEAVCYIIQDLIALNRPINYNDFERILKERMK